MDIEQVISEVATHPLLEKPLSQLLTNLLADPERDREDAHYIAITSRLGQFTRSVASVVLADPPAKPDMEAQGWKRALGEAVMSESNIEAIMQEINVLRLSLMQDFAHVLNNRVADERFYLRLANAVAYIAAMQFHDLDPALAKLTPEEQQARALEAGRQMEEKIKAALGGDVTVIAINLTDLYPTRRHEQMLEENEVALCEMAKAAIREGAIASETVLVCADATDDHWSNIVAAAGAPSVSWQPDRTNEQPAVARFVAKVERIIEYFEQSFPELVLQLQTELPDGQVHVIAVANNIAAAGTFNLTEQSPVETTPE